MEHKLSPHSNVAYDGAVKRIIIISLIAGTLDAIGAIVVYQADPLRLFQFIASGVFGAETAFSGGLAMALCGIFLHYFIASLWTILFFLIYPTTNVLKQNPYVTGLLYGVFVWIIMNLIVMPFTKIPPAPFNLKAALIGAAILMVMIGLPISLMTHRYYSRKNNQGTS